MSSLKTSGNSFALGMFLHSDLDDSQLAPFEFRVYAHLCRRANDELRAWGSQKNISEVCRMSVDSVAKALKSLEALGFISQESQTRDDGSRTTNLIRLLAPPLPLTAVGVYRSQRGGVPLKPVAEVYPLEVNPLEVKHTSITENSAPAQKILSVFAIATPDAHALRELSKPTPLRIKSPKRSMTRELNLEFMEIWNSNCGNLPQADRLNLSRESGFNEVFREYELDEAAMRVAFGAAARCVAADPFWNERKYGLDNLLRKGAVTAKAEKWRSSQPKAARAIPLTGPEMPQDAPRVTIGSQWVHPQSGQPLTVIEVHGNTVFFSPGGPILDYWLSEMGDWKPLKDVTTQKIPGEPNFRGPGVAA